MDVKCSYIMGMGSIIGNDINIEYVLCTKHTTHISTIHCISVARSRIWSRYAWKISRKTQQKQSKKKIYKNKREEKKKNREHWAHVAFETTVTIAIYVIIRTELAHLIVRCAVMGVFKCWLFVCATDLVLSCGGRLFSLFHFCACCFPQFVLGFVWVLLLLVSFVCLGLFLSSNVSISVFECSAQIN